MMMRRTIFLGRRKRDRIGANLSHQIRMDRGKRIRNREEGNRKFFIPYWYFNSPNFRPSFPKKRKSKKKNRLLDELSDLEIKRKPKIKYGGLTSSEEETGRRKTRGKKTTYVDTLGSDSEEVHFLYNILIRP